MTPATGLLTLLVNRLQPLPTLPIHSKMTKRMVLRITEPNRQRHEYLADAFDTAYNIPNLLYPLSGLTTKWILMRPLLAPFELKDSLSVLRGYGARTWSVDAECQLADGVERSARLRHRGQRTT